MRALAAASGSGPVAPAELTPATLGVSVERLEERLGLAAGAWAKRRLFALRTATRAFEHLGIRRGDVLIVEPGTRERPGQLVLRRGPQGLKLTQVKDCDESAQLHLALPEPGSEPQARADDTAPAQAEPAWLRSRTVGTLLAVVRPTRTGALRPVALRRPGRHGGSPAQRPNESAGGRSSHRYVGRGQNEPETERIEEGYRALESMLRRWRGSMAECGRLAEIDPARWQRWRKLDANLATLLDCLRVAHGTRLAGALIEEAAPVLRAMKREMKDSPLQAPAPSIPDIRPTAQDK